MEKKILLQDRKVPFACPECGDENHEWFDVYYSKSAQIKKAEKSYITKCKVIKEYVIVNVNHDNT